MIYTIPAEKTHYFSGGMKGGIDNMCIYMYNIYMNDKYRRTQTTVSYINYHFVFCPRYRRKIFNIKGVEQQFKEVVTNLCLQHDIDILAMECHVDHAHLFLNCPPKLSPADIMHTIKGGTAKVLLSEFAELSQMPNLWTRSYFVSTAGEVSSDTIIWYVNTQKTRS